MGRWEPGASGRFRQAAMDLYLERGFDQTTVADIAARAGLTSRTFFRYYADKREVLFDGSETLRSAMVEAVDRTPASAAPMRAVAAALDAAATMLGERRDFARRRQAVIDANAELRERELAKMASLAGALADGLRRRGVDEPDASLAAEAGIAVMRVAFARWVGDDETRDLTAVVRESLTQLGAITSRGGRRRASGASR
ncbi:MAG TPA: TetR family transcriptional regulator [Nocardioides sp.]|jgi:AcrR family transcriptional regulator|uniref:TetR family transcriptional regulator n=1 Tax=Nocardioides sp. TaxID=35761 RepID=UPI002E378B47|nr:TetR family transcriptional regulator [Nocardioides sp.]HEX3930138.1 TetR family transcriptional regulator [Nocardioides sp.]